MSTGAAVAAASCPPLIADRCLRTVFSASMSAPASSRRRGGLALVREREARLVGTAISEDAPPESSTRSRSSAGTPRTSASARCPASTLRSSGTGWLPSTPGHPRRHAPDPAPAPITSPYATVTEGVPVERGRHLRRRLAHAEDVDAGATGRPDARGWSARIRAGGWRATRRAARGRSRRGRDGGGRGGEVSSPFFGLDHADRFVTTSNCLSRWTISRSASLHRQT